MMIMLHVYYCGKESIRVYILWCSNYCNSGVKGSHEQGCIAVERMTLALCGIAREMRVKVYISIRDRGWLRLKLRHL
jgi:hypothetical protein